MDVGVVELGGKDENGKFVRKQLEVDFVVNRPPYRVYICLLYTSVSLYFAGFVNATAVEMLHSAICAPCRNRA